MPKTQISAFQADVLDLLQACKTGAVVSWPADRMALMLWRIEAASAAEMAGVAHLFIVEHLRAAHSAKLALLKAQAAALGGEAQQ